MARGTSRQEVQDGHCGDIDVLPSFFRTRATVRYIHFTNVFLYLSFIILCQPVLVLGAVQQLLHGHVRATRRHARLEAIGVRMKRAPDTSCHDASARDRLAGDFSHGDRCTGGQRSRCTGGQRSSSRSIACGVVQAQTWVLTL